MRIHETREQWLTAAITKILSISHLLRLDNMSIKASCSKPSTRTRRSVYAQRRADGNAFEIFIGAEVADELAVLEALWAAVTWCAIRYAGRQCRRGTILEMSGYMINRGGGGSNCGGWMFYGDSAIREAGTILADLGDYPHAALTVADVYRDTAHRGAVRSRQLRVSCVSASCPMIIRASSTRLLEIGIPVCACGSPMESAELIAICRARNTDAADAADATTTSNAARTADDAAALVNAIGEVGADLAGGVFENDRRTIEIRPSVDIDWSDPAIRGVASMRYFGAFRGTDLYCADRGTAGALFVGIVQASGSVYTAEPSGRLGDHAYAGTTQVERDTWQAQIWHAWNSTTAWRGGIFNRDAATPTTDGAGDMITVPTGDGRETRVKRSQRFRRLELDDITPEQEAINVARIRAERAARREAIAARPRLEVD